MDEREREYFKQQIQDLQRSNRRWRTIAAFFFAGFLLFLVVGGGTVTLLGWRGMQQAREAETRAAMYERHARMEAMEMLEVLRQQQEKVEKMLKEGPALEAVRHELEQAAKKLQEDVEAGKGKKEPIGEKAK